jgi:hypothetical protein
MDKTQELYVNHLKSVSEYQKRNKDKMREKNRRAYERLKQDPVRYAIRSAKSRESANNYYHNKVKRLYEEGKAINENQTFTVQN